MRDLWSDVEFWMAMAFVGLVKFSGSKGIGWRMALVSVALGIGASLAFTRSVIQYFSLNPDNATIPVAALIAITAEQVARQIQSMSLKEALDLWRGKSSGP